MNSFESRLAALEQRTVRPGACVVVFDPTEGEELEAQRRAGPTGLVIVVTHDLGPEDFALGNQFRTEHSNGTTF